MRLGNLKDKATAFLDQYKSQNPATYAAAQQAIGGILILDGFIGIDNPLGGRSRPGIFGSLIGVVLGIIFVFVPTIFGNLSGLNKMTATTTATIISVSQHQSTTTNSDGSKDSSTTCSAVAKYAVNGKEYTQTSSMSSSGMCSLFEGQTTQVYYNPQNPGQWATDVKTLGAFLKIFFFVGIAVVIGSLITFVIRLLSIIFGWKLLKDGRALAKTLPAGTDLSTVTKEIEHSFKTSLFGFDGGGITNPQPASIPVLQPQQPFPGQPVVVPQVVSSSPPQSSAAPESNNQYPPQPN